MPLTMAPIIIGTSSTSTKMIIAVPVIIVIASSSTCWMIIVTPIIGVTAWPVKKLRTDLEGGVSLDTLSRQREGDAVAFDFR
ncbi:hypothetical protein [Bradyrhizobium sp. CCBAU 51753]|uniref:hypothetical protein n=1 Tax=Bradyrhizobium sp. CCBAU 51753 TaxID=1325100 RepID=UPI00188ACB3C|nr:hypothetical protein [Bradyrhizobium sp. CCBAU 51753]QOZ24154.1 hypothetical protein XH93_11635 [Bradyrhizobium sp. CCBAU 51753]